MRGRRETLPTCSTSICGRGVGSGADFVLRRSNKWLREAKRGRFLHEHGETFNEERRRGERTFTGGSWGVRCRGERV